MSLLGDSYGYCERLARSKAGNFYHGFRLLPRPQRRAMCALYAFLRISDDITDEPGAVEEKLIPLSRWREQMQEALHGRYSHRIHPAFHDTVERFHIPRSYFEEALTGVGMDLEVRRYETFPELYRYCYRVASVVGLSCIHIWGFRNEEAKKHAEAAGIAFQLTNILRDLAEDASRDRIYLPRDELRRFDYDEGQLIRGHRGPQFHALMQFETDRAYDYYRLGEPLEGHLPAPGRAVFRVMLRTYRGLLDAIVQRDFDVFSGRVSLSRYRKMSLALQALPVRWGWW